MHPFFPIALLAAALAAVGHASPDPDPTKIDAIFAQYDRTNSPGCALGVYRDGRIILAKGYGMADLNQGIAIRPGTVFYIGSTSKQFTAFAIALAAEQGKLGLDDRIRKYVPELPAYTDSITIRQLVHHISGIRDYLGLWGTSGRTFADEIPEPAAIDLIARQKALDFAPGSRWSYSNSGYFLLSVIIERATGLSLRDFSERYMFGPLGMTHTHFHDDNREIVSQRAEGYDRQPGGGFQIVRTSYALVGDGGLYTTVEDLLRWDSNFYANKLGTGGQSLIDRVLTKGKLGSGVETDYAFGLFPATHRGLPIVQHGGAFIGYRAQLLRFPSERFSVAVLCNEAAAAPEAMAMQVAELYLADKLAPQPAATGAAAGGVAVSPARLDGYVGRYEVSPGMVVRIVRDGSGLEAQAFGQSWPLVAQSDTAFTPTGVPIDFVFRVGPKGPALFSKQLSTGEAAPRLAEPPTIDAASAAGFAGRYWSTELDTWATIEAKDGSLRVQTRYGPWMAMEPLTVDGFVAAGSRLAFEREKGRVARFKLSAPRLANVEFVREAPAGR